MLILSNCSIVFTRSVVQCGIKFHQGSSTVINLPFIFTIENTVYPVYEKIKQCLAMASVGHTHFYKFIPPLSTTYLKSGSQVD